MSLKSLLVQPKEGRNNPADGALAAECFLPKPGCAAASKCPRDADKPHAGKAPLTSVNQQVAQVVISMAVC